MALSKVGKNQVDQSASLTVDSDLTVDTNTLYVDSTNNRIGVGTSSPTGDGQTIHINGSIGYSTLHLTNSTTGSGSGDGTYVTTAGNDFFLRNREAGNMLFYTSNAERLRINDYGSVGIGRSDPQNIVGPHGGGLVVQSAADRAGTTTAVAFQNSSGNNQFQQLHNGETSFSTGSTLRMRIATDGSLLLGKASGSDTVVGCHIEPAYGGYKAIAGSSWPWGVMVNRQDNDGSAITLRRANTDVGSITVTGSSTSYNTSSDYRLKTAVNYDWDATTRLKQLRPARFRWIADGDDAVPVDGFLAHELATVIPESVTGTHNEVDDEGNPVYQGVDQSKLTPLLTKALIEAVEKIEQLETRIAALEAN